MSIYKLLSVALMIAFLSGCTASLTVKKDNGNENRGDVHGPPFRVPAVYVFSGVLTKHSTGAECDQTTPFYETHVLPSSELYYANVKTGALAKSEFAIELTDQGTLKRISLNSDTTVDDVASGTAKLLSTAIPLIPSSKSTKKVTSKGKLACNTGKVLKRARLFEKFVQ